LSKLVLTSSEAGQLSIGLTLSVIVISCVHEVLFPAASVIVHVLVTVSGQDPLAISTYDITIVPQLSDAEPLFVAPEKTA